MVAYNVYLCNRLIDTVFYTPTMTRDEVYTSLVNHDGYPRSCIVMVAKK